MDEISWSEFEKVELRVGTVERVEKFPEARKPAYKVWVNFGSLGVRKTSAQIVDHYAPEDLLGSQVLGVLNLPTKQIGPFESDFLLTGLPDQNGQVVIVRPERTVPDGGKLY